MVGRAFKFVYSGLSAFVRVCITEGSLNKNKLARLTRVAHYTRTRKLATGSLLICRYFSCSVRKLNRVALCFIAKNKKLKISNY